MELYSHLLRSAGRFDPRRGNPEVMPARDFLRALAVQKPLPSGHPIWTRDTHLAWLLLEVLDRMLEQPRVRLVREHRRVRISKAHEFDARCSRWLERQPGRTLAEKAGPNERLLAVERRFNSDLQEHRVAMVLVKRLLPELEPLLDGRSDEILESNVEPVPTIRRFVHAATLLLRREEFAELPPPLPGPPNHALLRDRIYSRAWRVWSLLRSENAAARTATNQGTMADLLLSFVTLFNARTTELRILGGGPPLVFAEPGYTDTDRPSLQPIPDVPFVWHCTQKDTVFLRREGAKLVVMSGGREVAVHGSELESVASVADPALRLSRLFALVDAKFSNATKDFERSSPTPGFTLPKVGIDLMGWTSMPTEAVPKRLRPFGFLIGPEIAPELLHSTEVVLPGGDALFPSWATRPGVQGCSIHELSHAHELEQRHRDSVLTVTDALLRASTKHWTGGDRISCLAVPDASFGQIAPVLEGGGGLPGTVKAVPVSVAAAIEYSGNAKSAPRPGDEICVIQVGYETTTLTVLRAEQNEDLRKHRPESRGLLWTRIAPRTIEAPETDEEENGGRGGKSVEPLSPGEALRKTIREPGLLATGWNDGYKHADRSIAPIIPAALDVPSSRCLARWLELTAGEFTTETHSRRTLLLVGWPFTRSRSAESLSSSALAQVAGAFSKSLCCSQHMLVEPSQVARGALEAAGRLERKLPIWRDRVPDVAIELLSEGHYLWQPLTPSQTCPAIREEFVYESPLIGFGEGKTPLTVVQGTPDSGLRLYSVECTVHSAGEHRLQLTQRYGAQDGFDLLINGQRAGRTEELKLQIGRLDIPPLDEDSFQSDEAVSDILWDIESTLAAGYAPKIRGKVFGSQKYGHRPLADRLRDSEKDWLKLDPYKFDTVLEFLDAGLKFPKRTTWSLIWEKIFEDAEPRSLMKSQRACLECLALLATHDDRQMAGMLKSILQDPHPWTKRGGHLSEDAFLWRVMAAECLGQLNASPQKAIKLVAWTLGLPAADEEWRYRILATRLWKSPGVLSVIEVDREIFGLARQFAGRVLNWMRFAASTHLEPSKAAKKARRFHLATEIFLAILERSEDPVAWGIDWSLVDYLTKRIDQALATARWIDKDGKASDRFETMGRMRIEPRGIPEIDDALLAPPPELAKMSQHAYTLTQRILEASSA